jgi:hypothetical protein
VGWRGVLAIPAAFGLLVAVAARALRESRNPVARPVDMAGTVTFTGGLFLLILALVEAPALGWDSGLVIGCLAGCVVLLAGFVLVEHLQRAPMFDLELLRYPRFVGVCAAATLAFTLLPVVVFLPTYFSAVKGLSAVHAGSTGLAVGPGQRHHADPRAPAARNGAPRTSGQRTSRPRRRTSPASRRSCRTVRPEPATRRQ